MEKQSLFTLLGLTHSTPKCPSSHPGGSAHTLWMRRTAQRGLRPSSCLPLSHGNVGPSSSASCVLASLWFPFQPVMNPCLCHLLQLPLPHPQAHPTARPPGEPRPRRPHPHPVLGQPGAQGMKKPTSALLSQTLGCLQMLRHQPSQGSPSTQLLSPLPWPHADPGQFLLTH